MEQEKKKRNWKSWIGSYIVAGLIFGVAQQTGFTKTTGGGLVSVIVAIGAGYFYHKLKNKIKIKNEPIRVIVTFILLEMIAGLLVGFLTPFANLSLIETGIDQRNSKGWTETGKANFIQESLNSCGTASKKFCTCIADYLIKNYSFEEVHNMANDINNKSASPKGVVDASKYCLSNINEQ